ncbi:hypothetical protein C8T65DRAFT_225414 [Cerioporus squamosus]|nr:hypothetical protein C8T65DRAFT_225414 [Cerioporus squamosus]
MLQASSGRFSSPYTSNQSTSMDSTPIRALRWVRLNTTKLGQARHQTTVAQHAHHGLESRTKNSFSLWCSSCSLSIWIILPSYVVSCIACLSLHNAGMRLTVSDYSRGGIFRPGVQHEMMAVVLGLPACTAVTSFRRSRRDRTSTGY